MKKPDLYTTIVYTAVAIFLTVYGWPGDHLFLTAGGPADPTSIWLAGFFAAIAADRWVATWDTRKAT